MIKSTKNLRKGDIIFATVGPNDERWEVQAPIEVTKVIGLIDNGPDVAPTVHIHVKTDSKYVSPDRYLMTTSYPKVEVGRKSTLAGIKFYKMDDDLYTQVDGPWTIEADYIPYECDDQHPVKLTTTLARTILAQPHLWSFEARNGARDFVHGQRNERGGRVKGYMCPGCEEHYERQWIGNNSDDSSFDHRGEWQENATEVAKLIASGTYS